MNVAIVGFGVEGKSAFDYWHKLGAVITICDRNTEAAIPEGAASQLGEGYADGLDKFDIVVRSAGIPPKELLGHTPGIESKMTTVVDEFLRVCPTKNTIGVTGTKGKGTTSTLITNMLEAAGKKVYLAGNIGRSPLDFLEELTPDDWVVLEFSSFQLSDIHHSPHIALSLMIVPEHLNWHDDFDDYVGAKSHIFTYQTADDIAVYYPENEASSKNGKLSKGTQIPYFAAPGALVQGNEIIIGDQVICKTSELKLLGKHNWQNVCAALTVVWQATQDVAAMRSVLTTFSGLPYRLELIRELDGVRYYNDSLGTTPETTIGAIEAFKEPKVMIVGGASKGVQFDDMAKATVAPDANVRTIVLIGDMAPTIEAALKNVGFTSFIHGGETMATAVVAAHDAAQSGDVVLLAPGCSSFDMFKDYKDRGDQFNDAVNQLQ
ncbi:MAG TPA: UDP-N-acetylmuramoyl-L-alanine--D-glutamate ligase [Candidatus Saccharimonadia bacterium]|nr:UDP-N-acetylmuramoyl-L-alanine--D-glutamate ligase [Candidatus Saccharimonadia bacterium]